MKKAGKKALASALVLCMVLSLLPVMALAIGSGESGARTASGTTGELFLGGNYIEVGLRSTGAFGTEDAAPTSGGVIFHPDDSNNRIGLRSNGSKNWSEVILTGTHGTTDFFLPGTIDEGYAVGWALSDGGTTTMRGVAQAYNSYAGTNNIEASVGIVDNSSADVLSATTSATADETLQIDQTVSFGVDDKFFTTTITLTNTGEDTLYELSYIRAFDPDQKAFDEDDGGIDSETDNYFYKDEGGNVWVMSFGNDSLNVGVDDTPVPVTFDEMVTNNPNAVTPFIFCAIPGSGYEVQAINCPVGWVDYRDTYRLSEGEYLAGDDLYGTHYYDDVGIGLEFLIDSLAAGKSASFSYVSSLDTDVSGAIEAIKNSLGIDLDKEYGRINGLEKDSAYTIKAFAPETDDADIAAGTATDTGTWTLTTDAEGNYTILVSGTTSPVVGSGSINGGVPLLELWYNTKLHIEKADDDKEALLDITTGEGGSNSRPEAAPSAPNVASGIYSLTITTVENQQYIVYDEDGNVVKDWFTPPDASGTCLVDGLFACGCTEVPNVTSLHTHSYTVKTRYAGSSETEPPTLPSAESESSAPASVTIPAVNNTPAALDSGSIDIYDGRYKDGNGWHRYTADSLVITQTAPGTPTANTVTVKDATPPALVLNGVNILPASGAAIISSGDLPLVLKGDNIVTSGDHASPAISAGGALSVSYYTDGASTPAYEYGSLSALGAPAIKAGSVTGALGEKYHGQRQVVIEDAAAEENATVLAADVTCFNPMLNLKANNVAIVSGGTPTDSTGWPAGVSYDAATNTLTLTGAELTQVDNYLDAVIAADGDINIALSGENSISSNQYDSAGIYADGDVTLSGTGSLDIEMEYCGIYTSGQCVAGQTGLLDISAAYAVNAGLDIIVKDGADLSATGYYLSLKSDTGVVFENGHAIAGSPSLFADAQTRWSGSALRRFYKIIAEDGTLTELPVYGYAFYGGGRYNRVYGSLGYAITLDAPPAEAAPEGKTFGGWYTQPNGGGIRVGSETLLTLDMLNHDNEFYLYANWVTPASAPFVTAIPVIVDGVEYNIGSATTLFGVTSVTLDQAEFQKQLAAAKETVAIPVALRSGANALSVQLIVSNIDDMAAKEITLSVSTDDVSYNIPAGAIDTEAIMTALGATDPTKAQVNVTITELENSAVTLETGTLLLPPVEFTVTAAYSGKTVPVEKFEKYVQRVIEIPSTVDAGKITTAVVVENGKQRHVPTTVFQKDGKWYTKINSLTNSTYALINYEASFTDDDGKWFEAVVTEMASRGIVGGRGEGIFDGDASITRAEFAAILVRALGLPENGSGAVFEDVASSVWYCGAVGKAYEYGLVGGRGAGIFDPQANITRQEAMAMLHRAAAITEFTGTDGTLSAFSDADSIGAWALKDAQWNVGSGLIQGSNAGTIRGQDNITRGETATIILRLLQKSELVDTRSNA